MTFRRASLLCLPILAMTTPGHAGELASPANRWSGCHATLQASYDDMSVENNYGARSGDNLDGAQASEDLSPGGVGVGGGFGCDWQSGRWVFGILGDGAFASLDDEVVESHFPRYRFGLESDWLATLRGRIGYAMDRGLIFNVPTMWYVTAGGAWAGLRARNFVPGHQSTGWDEETASGWTVGWGSENALDDRWSIKTETLYIDYGTNTFFTPNDPVSAGEFKTDTTEWVTRIGLTYKLNAW